MIEYTILYLGYTMMVTGALGILVLTIYAILRWLGGHFNG